MGFTIPQLHILKRQIQSFRRINIYLKALKSGNDLVNGLEDDALDNDNRGKSKKRSRARANAQRPVLLQTNSRSESEGPQDSSELELEDSDNDDSDMSETPEFSDDDSGAAAAAAAKPKPAKKRTKAALPRPRRRSSRPQSTIKSLKEASDSEEDDEEASDDGNGSPRKKMTGKNGQKKFVVVEDGNGSEEESVVQLTTLKLVHVPWPEDDAAACSVCGDGDATDDNVILLCEGKGCTVAVHQACYGVEKVPKGKWLCDGCKSKLKSNDANCALCPVVGGAVRKVESLGSVLPAHPGKTPFVHVACALWTPEPRLMDPAKMDKIDISRLRQARMTLRCALCKQGGGGVIQCSYGSCCRSFHVLCGRFAGHEITFRATDGEPLAFCAMHSRSQYDAVRSVMLQGGDPEQVSTEQGLAAQAAPEPAELVAYELKRQDNLRRIEEAKKAIFSRGKGA